MAVVVVLLEFRREAVKTKAFSLKTLFRDFHGLDSNATSSCLLKSKGVFGWKVAGRRKLVVMADMSVAVAIFRWFSATVVQPWRMEIVEFGLWRYVVPVGSTVCASCSCCLVDRNKNPNFDKGSL